MLWKVKRYRGGIFVAVLGQVRAPHHPAAMLRAFAKWPKVSHGEISARPATMKAKKRASPKPPLPPHQP